MLAYLPNPPRLAAIWLIAGTLASCATPTPYQPDVQGQEVEGGYSDQKIGEGRYRVSFAGNCYTSRDRVEGYLMYRAAELTLEEGYDWFLILDRMTEREAETHVYPDPAYRPWYGAQYRYWRPWWRYHPYGDTWYVWSPLGTDPFWDTHTVTVEKFEAHAEIDLRHGDVPSNEERGFDARTVIADLNPTIERPSIDGGSC